MYGGGLRVTECLRLRVKDLDFEYRQVTVRDGKGSKDRFTILPSLAEAPVRQQLERVRVIFQADRTAGRLGVSMPPALARKYPSAPSDWAGSSYSPAGAFCRSRTRASGSATICCPRRSSAR